VNGEDISLNFVRKEANLTNDSDAIRDLRSKEYTLNDLKKFVDQIFVQRKYLLKHSGVYRTKSSYGHEFFSRNIFNLGVDMKSIVSLFLFCLIIIDAHAGWENNVPVRIGETNAGDVHFNGGGRRIVRIQNHTFALCSNGSIDNLYHSANNGTSWQAIDNDGGYSGCLITGKDSTIYHFFKKVQGSTLAGIYMVKFKYTETPPTPRLIFEPNSGSRVLSDQSQYHMLNAIVDSSGKLFVSTHYGTPDKVYLFRSYDFGATWEGPIQVSDDNSKPWYYMHLEFDTANVFHCVYNEWLGEHGVKYAYSTNFGTAWTTVTIPGSTWEHQYLNTALLTIGSDTVFIAGQKIKAGLFYNMSYNKGVTWTGWKSIETTASYADPSVALGNSNEIYVAFRSDNNRTSTDYRCRLAASTDLGATWSMVDSFYSASNTVGTRNQLRYQTWWNYGGPLEWIWMQQESNSRWPTYYDINTDVHISTLPKDKPVELSNATQPKLNHSKIGFTSSNNTAQIFSEITGPIKVSFFTLAGKIIFSTNYYHTQKGWCELDCPPVVLNQKLFLVKVYSSGHAEQYIHYHQ
jgi:hypothetical protein